MYSKEEILAMEPSRELDVLVAQEVKVNDRQSK